MRKLRDKTRPYTENEPSHNGYVERFHRTYREDALDMNIFENIYQVREITKEFIEDYNNEHPHDSLGNMSPVEFMKS